MNGIRQLTILDNQPLFVADNSLDFPFEVREIFPVIIVLLKKSTVFFVDLVRIDLLGEQFLQPFGEGFVIVPENVFLVLRLSGEISDRRREDRNDPVREIT